MRDAVIVEALRTPIGKRHGSLASMHPVDLSAAVLNGIVARTGLDPALVDDVVWGCVSQVGEQGLDIARNAVLAAGWPESVPGTSVDRACGSSQQAIQFAASGVIAGYYDFVVAGGTEVMSRVPLGASYSDTTPGSPFSSLGFSERYDGMHPHQGVSAELMVKQWSLSRHAMDEYALVSHARAAAAQDARAFDAEIHPVTLPDGRVVSGDEGVRRGGTVETLGSLRSAFQEGGAITAGNSSQISDGSAAVLITTSDLAKRHGLRPLARIHTCVVTADDPVLMLGAPIPATRMVLKRSGVDLADVGVFEVNEAFSCMPLAWLAEIGADPTLLNPNGGAIALGHPLGASGARLMTTMVHHMQQRGIRYGLQTMCEGGGQANATVLERL